MRIISNFHDYYDGLQDPSSSVIWKRKTTEFEKNPFDIPKYGGSLKFIGFIGKFYVLFPVSHSRNPNYVYEYVYGQEAIDRYIKECNLYRHKYNEAYTNDRIHSFLEKDYTSEFCRRGILTTCHYFVGNKRYSYINPNLRAHQFYKIMDVYTTYQNLDMFMNKIVMPEPVIAPLDDAELVRKKGFNEQSFRKGSVKNRY